MQSEALLADIEREEANERTLNCVSSRVIKAVLKKTPHSKSYSRAGGVYTCRVAPWEAEVGGCEFEAHLDYTIHLKLTWPVRLG